MPQRTFVAALAFIAFISLGLPDGLLGVSWPSIRDDFALPLDRLGFLVAITTAGYLISSFLQRHGVAGIADWSHAGAIDTGRRDGAARHLAEVISNPTND